MEYIHREGIGGFHALFQDYLRDPRNWVYPTPIRVGFISASAVAAKIWGPDFRTLSYVSLLSCGALILVNYYFLERFFGNPRALFVTALTSFSPVWLALGRRALMDSFVTLCMALSIWLFLDLVRHPQRTRIRILFMLAFAFAILTKETPILLEIPLFAFVLSEKFVHKSRVKLGDFIVTLALPPVVCGAALIVAAGGLNPLLRVIQIILASPSDSYSTTLGSGPWQSYLIDFLLLSPWPTLLAVGYLGVQAVRLGKGVYESTEMYFMLIFSLLLLEFSFLPKFIRYLAILDLPIRIFAVSMLFELINSNRPVLRAAVCGLLVATLCWWDYQTFKTVFIEKGVYDLSSYFMLHATRIIP
jgi:4-amino-4-deoxy-L-arabinose transferase-like glycosyltransferase